MASLAHTKLSAHGTTLDRVCDTLQEVACVLMLVTGIAVIAAILVLLLAL
jgi:phosphatidylglycerophosphate synthase